MKGSIFLKSLYIGILSWLLSIFLYSPRLTLFLGQSSGITRRDDLLAQCIEPFTKNLYEKILSNRIVQPLIANSLGWCGQRREILALMGSPVESILSSSAASTRPGISEG